jgi:hypothetical protein
MGSTESSFAPCAVSPVRPDRGSVVKILVVGPAGAGKSSISHRFCRRLSMDEPLPAYQDTAMAFSFRIHPDSVQTPPSPPPATSFGRPCPRATVFSDVHAERAHRVLASSGWGFGANIMPFLDRSAGRALRATSVSLNRAVHKYHEWPPSLCGPRPRQCVHGDFQAVCPCWVRWASGRGGGGGGFHNNVSQHSKNQHPSLGSVCAARRHAALNCLTLPVTQDSCTSPEVTFAVHRPFWLCLM